MLITIRSLLDDEPYKHEPAQQNNPEFNRYVQYSTWKCLLLDYLAKETDPTALVWLRRYVRENGQEMLRELSKQQQAANVTKQKTLRSLYGEKHVIQVDYPALINQLKAAVAAAHQVSGPANNGSRLPPAVDLERIPKRKAGSAPEMENEENQVESKRAKRPSTPDIIDLT